MKLTRTMLNDAMRAWDDTYAEAFAQTAPTPERKRLVKPHAMANALRAALDQDQDSGIDEDA